MARKATIKDVAKAAGVSHATVSMVFSGKKRMSDRTRDIVLATARELQYVPNLGASNLRKGESRLIGFIVNDIANPVYGRMAQVAESLALTKGYQLIIADHQWNPEGELAAIEKLISFRARGLLWCGTEQSEASLSLLNYPGGPAVIALDNSQRDYRGASIGYDVRNTGAIAARHLVQNGAKNPVLFTAHRDLRSLSSFSELREGFLAALKADGLDDNENRVIYSGLSQDEGYLALHQLQQSGLKAVDGILAINDLCAYGIMEAADELGIKIGEDLALMGIGNHPNSRMPRISLTSVAQSPDRIVTTAMEELFACIADKRAPTLRMRFPSELIVRKSSQLSKAKRGS